MPVEVCVTPYTSHCTPALVGSFALILRYVPAGTLRSVATSLPSPSAMRGQSTTSSTTPASAKSCVASRPSITRILQNAIAAVASTGRPSFSRLFLTHLDTSTACALTVCIAASLVETAWTRSMRRTISLWEVAGTRSAASSMDSLRGTSHGSADRTCARRFSAVLTATAHLRSECLKTDRYSRASKRQLVDLPIWICSDETYGVVGRKTMQPLWHVSSRVGSPYCT